MPRSHRLRTGAGAAALVAAMVLAPTAALAAETPTGEAPTDVVSVAPAVETPTDTTIVVPTDAPTTVPSPADDAPSTSVVLDPVDATPAPAEETAPSTAPSPTPNAPAAPATPAPTSVVIVPDESAGPSIDVFFPAVSPGDAVTVDADDFTPGASVDVAVEGDAVTETTRFIVHTVDDPFVVDSDGYANFTMDIPADLALGTLTLTVTDSTGLSASAEIEVRAAVPAPVVTAPVDATAGVVTITGRGGVAGAVALVNVIDADQLTEDDFGPASWSLGWNSLQSSDRAAADPWEGIPFDTEPVEWDEDFGFATAITRVESDGTFSARFELPAGDYAVSATLVLDPESAFFSEDSQLLPFSVGEAATVVPAAGETPTAVSPDGNTTVVADGTDRRDDRGTLAYTGADQGLWIAGAAALLALGTALIAAPRLRRRFGR
jgi:hypothetical protein